MAQHSVVAVVFLLCVACYHLLLVGAATPTTHAEVTLLKRVSQVEGALEAVLKKLEQQQAILEQHSLVKSDGGLPKNYVERCQSGDVTIFSTDPVTVGFPVAFRRVPALLVGGSDGTSSAFRVNTGTVSASGFTMHAIKTTSDLNWALWASIGSIKANYMACA